MDEITKIRRELEESAPEIAAFGVTDELAKALNVTRVELERWAAEGAGAELIAGTRQELARLLSLRLFLMVPEALGELYQRVRGGNLRAIENVLDRGGMPRTTRSDVRTLNVNQLLAQRADFKDYVEQAGGDLDQIEAALGQLKKDAVEGEWREGDDEE